VSTAATFRRSLGDGAHATSFLVNDVDHCRDHPGLADRRLDHLDHRLDDRHRDHPGHLDDRHPGHLDDRHRDHLDHLDHLDDLHLGRHLGDLRREQRDALGRRCQQDHDQARLPAIDPCVLLRHHLDDQRPDRSDHLVGGPLEDDQLPDRLDEQCPVAVEFDDHHLVAAELDDRLAPYARLEQLDLQPLALQQLVQQERVPLVAKLEPRS
jgi:hypothetical protein